MHKLQKFVRISILVFLQVCGPSSFCYSSECPGYIYIYFLFTCLSRFHVVVCPMTLIFAGCKESYWFFSLFSFFFHVWRIGVMSFKPYLLDLKADELRSLSLRSFLLIFFFKLCILSNKISDTTNQKQMNFVVREK